MTVENKDQDDQKSTDNTKLYAGKFASVEALEEGYKNAAKTYQENEALKKQLADHAAPTDYLKPAELPLDDKTLEEVKAIAKNSKLTQAQFEHLAMETHARQRRRADDFEAKQKSLGEEKLNILKDYVKQNYPDEIGGTVLKKLITDEKARQAALDHRERALNNKLPGMGSSLPSGQYAVTDDDIVKAREAMNKMPSNPRLKETYLKLMKIKAGSK